MPSDTDTWGPQNSKLKTKQPNQTRSNGEYGNHQANGRLHNRVPEALKTLEHSLALPKIIPSPNPSARRQESPRPHQTALSLPPSLSLPTPAPAFSHPDATFPCRFAASPAPSLPTPNRAASPLRFPPTLSPNREEGSVPCSAWLHGFPACWSLSGDSEPEVECFLMVFFDGGGREREGQDGGGGGGGYQRGH